MPDWQMPHVARRNGGLNSGRKRGVASKKKIGEKLLNPIRIAMSTALGEAPICAESAMPTGQSNALDAVFDIN